MNSEQAAGPIVIASDHAGLEMKAELRAMMEEAGHTVLDLGPHSRDSVDYPDFADALAAALKDGRAARGVLICGSGIGISIAANRHRHVRAALCHDATTARLCREHNDANVIVLGARTTGAEIARDCVTTFLATPFAGGRHARRVAKLC
ncbi:ribose 5-phosphate isomerase B [Indioceanicola profundi]|uniref:ribose 5-phosphate isomerase B n=1 Tax=Indioceanicola profundi TaxID=2220096 RepID=UPI000E6AAF81|nr:ribose 5-phosphate isomerase B [Indioceanicola profundi]